MKPHNTMVPIDTIYLDLDDVLNRFTMYALKAVGCDIDIYDESSYPIEAGYDIVRAANILRRKIGYGELTTDEFWALIEQRLWAEVPVSGEFEYLIAKSSRIVAPYRHVNKTNVYVLSTPTLHTSSVEGKVKWLQKYMPLGMRRQYHITPYKTNCARPGALLIDDSPSNVVNFRRAGGFAILVPRPWNLRYQSVSLTNALNEITTYNDLIENAEVIAFNTTDTWDVPDIR